MFRMREIIRGVALAAVLVTVAACGGGGGGDSPSSSPATSVPGNTAPAVKTIPVPGVPGGIPVSANGTCAATSDGNFNYRCPANAADAAALNTPVAGTPPYSLTLPSIAVSTGTGNCSASVDSNGTANFNGGSYGSDAIPFASAVVLDMTATQAFLQSAATAQSGLTSYGALLYIDRSNPGHMILFIAGTVNGTQVVIGGDAQFSNVASNPTGTFVECLNTGTATAPPPTSLSCSSSSGGGTNGLAFYAPTGYTSYQLNTTQAQASMVSTLSWGAQYENPAVGAGSTTGSLQAELWAVPSSYSGGTITGHPLGVFTPNFTGSGAASATQLFDYGYSTNTITSNAAVTNPPAGSYCIVATLNEYVNGGFEVVDWVQFNGPATFQ